MTVARALAVALVGVDGTLVEVEADLAPGLPGLTITGLPDAALSEARDRVRAAVVNSGEEWPRTRITVGLSPADLPKRGSAYDLALAASILATAGSVPAAALGGRVLLGELGLDGAVRPVPGVLPAVLAAQRAGVRRAIVASANLAEARLLPSLEVVGVATLRELLVLLRTGAAPDQPLPADPLPPPAVPDLADVAGQGAGRRAMEVAAAGGHHVLLHGPPGTGKTMLAERLPGLLPPLELVQALEVTAVHSVAGLLPRDRPLLERPPFQDPHHSASRASVIGGGSGVPRPGAVSLASHGVLFLDEAPEFGRDVLDALRQPLESGRITVRRAAGSATYPARFLLVMAANHCPCGRPRGQCRCAADASRRYLGRLSGPLLDRVDLRVAVDPVSRAELLADRAHVEGTAVVAARVATAREAVAERWPGLLRNADAPPAVLKDRRWVLPRRSTAWADRAVDGGTLSARGYWRVLRMAWTLADLVGRSRPGPDEVCEALALRLDPHEELAA